MKRVPSYLDEAISMAQKRLGILPPETKNIKKTVKRPNLLELSQNSKPRITLPIGKNNNKSWLSKKEELSLEKDKTENYKKRPIWKIALDDLNQNEKNPFQELTNKSEELINWPPILSMNLTKTMEDWQIVEENRQLTKTIENIIERPGGHLNPIHIKGDYGVGKTHISLASSYEIQSYYGLESVRIILSSTLSENSVELPIFPQHIPNLKMIIIEDFEDLLNNQSRMQAISNWIIWNINKGIQILITSNGKIDPDLIGGDTKRLLESSIDFKIEEYSDTSKMRMLRRLAIKRNVVLSDQHLSILISSKKSLPSLLSSFEKLIIAQKDGTLPTDPKEAIESLDGVKHLYNSMFTEDLIDTAKDLALKTVESTNSSEFKLDQFEFDLELETEELPEFNSINSEAQKLINHDDETISKWKENLDLPKDIQKSNELLNELSEHGLNRMADVGVAFEKYNEILSHIENRMKNISRTLEESDTQTLLDLADEISDLEYSLQDLKPLISSFERNSLTIEPEENIELPNLEKLKELDEYVPNNEWNIDSEEISMDDLLNDVQLNPVSHAVLVPTSFSNLEEE